MIRIPLVKYYIVAYILNKLEPRPSRATYIWQHQIEIGPQKQKAMKVSVSVFDVFLKA